MNGLFKLLPKGVFILVYADDILLVSVADTNNDPQGKHKAARKKLQAAATAVKKWATSCGFRISAAKSVHTIICPRKHRAPSRYIQIGEDRVPFKRTIKVLGVLVDSGLTFNAHFQQVKRNCSSRINVIRTISKNHRSNNRAIRMKVAKAIINSRLTYGLELTALARENLIGILEPTYNQSLRIISGLLPSTPAESVCAECGTPPFEIFIDATIVTKTASFVAKTKGNNANQLTRIANSILRPTSGTKLPAIAKSRWHGSRAWDHPGIRTDNRIRSVFKAGEKSAELPRAFQNLIKDNYATHEIRYTDGSRSGSGVGLGVYSESGIQESRRLPGMCSSYSAEAAGLLLAVTLPSSKPLLIVTDSASALDELSNNQPTHPFIQATLRSLPDNTTFLWVPGHSNIDGNHKADELAGIGHFGEFAKRVVPLADFKKWTKRTFRRIWDERWMCNTDAFLRRIKRDVEPIKDVSSLRDQRILSRLRTGHTRFAYNYGGGQFRRNCDICEIHNSVGHVLTVCPQYEGVRRAYGIDGSVRNILGGDPVRNTILFSFLTDTGLIHEI